LNRILVGLAVATVGLTGCSFDTNSATSAKADTCWSQTAKTQVEAIVQDRVKAKVKEIIANALDEQKARMDQKSADLLVSEPKVSLSHYYVESFEPHAGSYVCGVAVSATAEHGATTAHTDGNIVSFNVFQGDSGPVVTVATDSVHSLASDLISSVYR